MIDAGSVWALWRGTGGDDPGAGVLVGIYADKAAAREAAAEYRRSERRTVLVITEETVRA